MTPIAYFLLLGDPVRPRLRLGALRRNALRIFMGVELQLNAVNLTLVAFSRMHLELDGQILAFFSMVVAAAEVVVGLAIIVAVPTNGDDRRRPSERVARMIDLIGLAIAIPLLAAAVNMLFGARLGRWAGWFATAAMATSFAIVLGALLDLVSLPAEDRTQIVTVAEWIRAGAASVARPAGRPALDHDGDGRDGGRVADPSLRDRVHGPRPGQARFFGYMNLFCAFMLVLVLANDFLLLYLGWEGVGPLLVPADRVLVGPSGGAGEEGVHHHPRRRRAADARSVRDVAALRLVRLRHRARARGLAARDRHGDRHRDLAAAARGRRRRRGRCTCGCPTRWPVRPPSPP